MRDRLFELRKQYEGITAPSELTERMQNIMQQERKKTEYRRFGRVCKRIAATAAVFVGVIGIFANAGSATAHAMANIPIVGDLAKLLTFRTYEDAAYGVEAKIQIPQIEGLENAEAQKNLNAAVQAYADQLIAMHEEDVAGSQSVAEANPELGVQGHVSMDTTFQVITDDARVFSLAMQTDLIMASGVEMNEYFTVDKATGKVLALADLFRPDADYASILSAEILMQMKAQMAEDEGRSYFIGADDPDPFTAIDKAESFYITPEGKLVISFDEYTVAPGYMGPVSFTIPTSAIADIIQGNLLQ